MSRQEEYLVDVTCSFTVPFKASSLDEAIENAREYYRSGRGQLPRDQVEVSNHQDNNHWST